MNSGHRCERCGALHPRESTIAGCPTCLVRLPPDIPGAPTTGLTTESAPSECVAMAQFGLRIGSYELMAPLGEDGMGTVYRARHVRLNRIFALKLLPFGRFSSEAHQKRFLAEAKAIAQLRHPHIVTVYEIGEHDGQPFLSMELVDGPDLATILPVRPFGIRDAARLIERVARAIHYAHLCGVAHRDLKPSNILIDADRQPRVTDFGLATNAIQASDRTITGRPCGSPHYISPEQATQQRDIDAIASDVYGIGAVLYHLLTRRPPFVGDSVGAVLKQLSAQDPLPPRWLDPEVPRDLETICLKCLEKDPARRYGSTEEVAAELTRFLRFVPIRARPAGAAARMWRWCRRRPTVAAMTVLTLLTLAGGLAMSVRQWKRAQDRSHAATETLLRVESERAEEFFERDGSPESLAGLARLLRANPSNLVVAQRIVSALSHRNFLLPASPEFENVHDGTLSALAISGNRLIAATDGGRQIIGWNTAGVFASEFKLSLDQPARVAALTADGGMLAIARKDRSLQLWHLVEPAPKLIWSAGLSQIPTRLQFNRTGSRLLAMSAPTGVSIVDGTTGDVLKVMAEPQFADLSPDGRWFVTATHNEAVLWDARACVPAGRVFRHADRIEAVRFSPDSQRLVTASADRSACIWEADSGEPVGGRLLHQGQVLDAVFSPDGQRVLTQIWSSHAMLWDAVSGLPISPPFPQGRELHPALFSPDGLWLASHFRDRVCLRDAFTGEAVSEPIITGPASAVRFLGDGTRFVTTGDSGRTRVWSTQSGDAAPLVLPHNGSVISAGFSRDGARLLTCASEDSAQVWSTADGRRAGGRRAHEHQITVGTFDAAGALVATGDVAGTVRIWRADSGELEAGPLSHRGEITGLAFSRDGRFLIATSSAGVATAWAVRGGRKRFEVRHGGSVRALALSDDGRYGATVADDRTIRVWSLATGAGLAAFELGAPASCVAFSPDGGTVATGDGTGQIRFWNFFGRREAGPALHHAGPILSLRFSRDGRKLASGSSDRTARVWDPAGRRAITPPLVHRAEVAAASLSPDGEHVLTASYDKTVRVWSIATGRPVSDGLRHGNRVVDAEWAPDGKSFVTASRDGSARVWAMPILRHAPARAEWLADVAEAFGGLKIDDNDVLSRVSRDRLVELAWVRPVSGDDPEFRAWAQWLMAERTNRAISANASVGAAQHARIRFDDTKADRLREALRFVPMDPAGLARWSRLVQQQSFESNPRKQAESAFAAELARRMEALGSGSWQAAP